MRYGQLSPFLAQSPHSMPQPHGCHFLPPGSPRLPRKVPDRFLGQHKPIPQLPTSHGFVRHTFVIQPLMSFAVAT